MTRTSFDRIKSEPDRRIRGLSLGRLGGLSDGVFAVVMTLLVLLIEVPPMDLAEGQLVQSLLKNWHMFIAYALSFLLVTIHWLRHHTIFHYLVRADWTLVGLNMNFMMWVALVPFPTGLLTEYFQTPQAEIAILLYSVVQLACTLSLLALWAYAVRGNRLVHRLLDGEAKRLTWLLVVDAALFTVAIVVSFFSHLGGMGLLGLVLVLHLLPHSRLALEVDLERCVRPWR